MTGEAELSYSVEATTDMGLLVPSLRVDPSVIKSACWADLRGWRR